MNYDPSTETLPEFKQQQLQAYKSLNQIEAEILSQIRYSTSIAELSWKFPALPVSRLARRLVRLRLIAPRDLQGCIVYQNIYRDEKPC